MAILTASWAFDFAIGLMSIFFAIYLFFQRSYKYWGKCNVPHTNPKFPFGDIGKSLMTEGIHVALTRIYNSFRKEKVAGIWSFSAPILVVIDLDVVKDVLVKDFMSFHDRGVYFNEKDDPLSANLFSIGGTKWRNLRAKLSPTFTSGKMKMMFPILVDCSNEFAVVLYEFAKRKEIVEMKEYLARFTTDVISSCAFGLEANSLKDPEALFRKMGKRVFDPSFSNAISFFFFINPKIGEFFKATLSDSVAAKFFLNAVRETVDYRKANDVNRKDFMQLLIQLMEKGKIDDVDEGKEVDDPKDKTVHKFTFEEAAAEAFLFFLAGFETSSTTMQFALYELALKPNMQEKLRREVKSVLAKYNGEITYEAVYEMEFLGRVIDESLRKYPPATFLFRQCNKDFQISGTNMIVPKGASVQIPVYAIHHDPVHYPDPDRFDPDRFKEEVKSKRHHYAYLPFGDGPRNCIGMRFGLMQIRVGLVKLLSRYKFDICEKSPLPMVFEPKSSVLSPKNGMHLRISEI